MSSFLTNIFKGISEAFTSSATLEAEVLADVAMGSSLYAEFEAGNAVRVATITNNGEKIVVVAFKEGGAAATALGM